MSESVGYHSPAVYLPQTSTLSAHLSLQPVRDRSENLVTSSGVETDKLSDLAIGSKVEATGAGGENFGKTDYHDDRQSAERQIDRRSEVLAQELARKSHEYGAFVAETRKVAVVASPSEMVGTEDALNRLDQNRDGKIDQMEVKHAYRAEDEGTTYEALSLYRKTVSLTGDPGVENSGDKKLFSDEDAQVHKVNDTGEAAQHDGTTDLFDDEDVERTKLFGESVEEDPDAAEYETEAGLGVIV